MNVLIEPPEPHHPDLAERFLSDTDNLWIDNDQTIEWTITTLEGGMVSGAPSVCLRLDWPDGRTVFVQTSVRVFLQTAEILRAKYEPETLTQEGD